MIVLCFQYKIPFSEGFFSSPKDDEKREYMEIGSTEIWLVCMDDYLNLYSNFAIPNLM